jgi:predicted XRE-type DNA-binding protein
MKKLIYISIISYCLWLSFLFSAVGSGVWDISNGVFHWNKFYTIFFHFAFYIEVSLVIMVYAAVKSGYIRFKLIVIIAFIISMFTMTRNEFENVLLQRDRTTNEQIKTIDANIVINQKLLDRYLTFNMLTKSEPVQKYLRVLMTKKEVLISKNAKSIDSVALKDFIYKFLMYFFLQLTNVLCLHLFFKLLEGQEIYNPNVLPNTPILIHEFEGKNIVPMLRRLNLYLSEEQIAERLDIKRPIIASIINKGIIKDNYLKQKIVTYVMSHQNEIRLLLNRKKTFYLT